MFLIDLPDGKEVRVTPDEAIAADWFADMLESDQLRIRWFRARWAETLQEIGLLQAAEADRMARNARTRPPSHMSAGTS